MQKINYFYLMLSLFFFCGTVNGQDYQKLISDYLANGNCDSARHWYNKGVDMFPLLKSTFNATITECETRQKTVLENTKIPTLISSNNTGKRTNPPKDNVAKSEEKEQPLPIPPKDATFYNSEGVEQFKLKNYGNAIKCFEEAIKIKFDFALAYYNLGLLHYYTDDYANSIKFLGKLIILEPDNADGYLSMGDVYYKKRDYNKAIEFFENAIKLKPVDADTYRNIGATYYYKGKEYYDKGKYDEAIICFERAIELKYPCECVYVSVGNAYFKKGDKVKANEWYKEADLIKDKK